MIKQTAQFSVSKGLIIGVLLLLTWLIYPSLVGANTFFPPNPAPNPPGTPPPPLVPPGTPLPPGVQVCNVTASTIMAFLNQSVRISWQTAGYTSVRLNGELVELNGARDFVNLQGTVTFSLRATAANSNSVCESNVTVTFLPFPAPTPIPVPPTNPGPVNPPPVSPPTNPPVNPPVNPPSTPPVVPVAVPSLSMRTEASPTPVSAGTHNLDWNQNITSLRWSGRDAVTCEGDGFDTGGAVDGIINYPHSSLSLTPGGSKSFRLRCANSQGVNSNWVTITVIKSLPPPAALPNANLSVTVTAAAFPYLPAANNHTIGSSQNLERLTWGSNNAESCEGDGFDTAGQISGSVNAPDPSLQINPGQSKVYRVRCRNSDNVWSAWVRIGFDKVALPPPAANLPPDRPLIRGIDRTYSPRSTAAPDELVHFTVFAVDPDGDTLFYEIDFLDGNLLRLPANGFVPSNSDERFVRSWSVESEYRFRARAIDSRGNSSAWADHSIVIQSVSTPPPPPDPMQISVSVNPQLVRYNESTTVRVAVLANYPADCSLVGMPRGVLLFRHEPASLSVVNSFNTGPLLASQIFRLSCIPLIAGVGSAQAEARVNVIPLIQER